MFSQLWRNQWYERIEFSSCYCLINDRLNTTLHTVYVHPSKSIQIHPNPSMSTLCIMTRAKQNSESIKFFQFVEISLLVWPAVDCLVYWRKRKILDGPFGWCSNVLWRKEHVMECRLSQENNSMYGCPFSISVLGDHRIWSFSVNCSCRYAIGGCRYPTLSARSSIFEP